MDLSVSPDVAAYLCYGVVLLLGLIAAIVQVSKRLENYPGKWIMLNTWLLFAAYVAIPVALFWMLDRTGAIHDTSLFAAVLVGIGYQQILSSGLSSIRAPGDASKLWQPFDTWANSIAARIRARVAVNDSQFDEKLLSAIVSDPKKLESLRHVVMTHTDKPVALNDELKKLDDAAMVAALGDEGVRVKKASMLYLALKQASPQNFQFLLRRKRLIDTRYYFWYAKEWRSKLTTSLVAVVLLCTAGAGVHWLLGSQQRASYFVWRLSKSNATESDHYRALDYLRSHMADSNAAYLRLGHMLKDPTLPPATADTILSLFVQSRSSVLGQQPDLRNVLIDALRNGNSDVRARVQKVLLYLTDDRSFYVPEELKQWKSDPKDSASDLDTIIARWRAVAPKTGLVPANPSAGQNSLPAPGRSGPAAPPSRAAAVTGN